MDKARYLARRRELESQAFVPRTECPRCERPPVVCFCHRAVPFSPPFRFAILIHRHEMRRSIATGRLAHLCLPNSYLWEGTDFADDERVEALLRDPRLYPVVLSPAPGAVNLTTLSPHERQQLFPADRTPVIFLLDGTWAQARRMQRLATNLTPLPHLYFDPPTPSRFLVRQQPEGHCYSTLEAIHHFLELMTPEDRRPQTLLEVLAGLVETQLEFGALALKRDPERKVKNPNINALYRSRLTNPSP